MTETKDRAKGLDKGDSCSSTRVVTLPVFSTKVLAGLETDETLAKVKSVQRKKRRNRYRRNPLK